MTTIDVLLKRDLKKEPILLINKRLNKYRNTEIPSEKKEKVQKLIANSNLFEAIQKDKNH